MKGNNDIMKKFLRESYTDYPHEKNVVSWENIESSYKEKLRNIKYRKSILYSSISLLLLLVFTIFINLKHKANETELVEQTDQSYQIAKKSNNENGLLNESRPSSQTEILSSTKTINQTMPLIDENKYASLQDASVSSTVLDSEKEKLQKVPIPDIADQHIIRDKDDPLDSLAHNQTFNINLLADGSDFQKHNFYVKFNVSASYKLNQSEIRDERLPEIHEDYLLIKSTSERLNMSFSGGVNLLYCYNERLSIQSGLFFSQYQTFGQYDFSNDKIPVRDSASNHILGYLTGSGTVTVNQKIKNSISYLEIPLVLGLQKNLSEKIYINIKSGLSYSLLLQTKGVEINYYNLEPEILNKQDYKLSNWGLIFGLGCYYKINNRVILGIEPTYKKYIKTYYLTESALIDLPAFVGINTIFLYKLTNNL